MINVEEVLDDGEHSTLHFIIMGRSEQVGWELYNLLKHMYLKDRALTMSTLRVIMDFIKEDMEDNEDNEDLL